MIRALRRFAAGLLERLVRLRSSDELVIYPALRTAEDAADAMYRASFYFREHKIYYAVAAGFSVERPEYLAADIALSSGLKRVSAPLLLWKIVTLCNVLIVDSGGLSGALRRMHRLSNIYDVDRRRNKGEALAYYRAHDRIVRSRSEPPRYLDLGDLPRREVAFVFGSGPSLGAAYAYDFQRVPSYKIICNTIVKNRRLLEHIRPDFVVCADAAFHFGPSVYAARFRRDLLAYLVDVPACKLLIPEDYYPFFVANVYDGGNLYTIPCLRDERINMNLREEYAVHNHGTILNRLQLPLASSLSDTVVLLGFDGRSKGDQARGNKYWTSHASDSNYPDLMDTVLAAHPHIDTIDKDSYAQAIADKTERILAVGEQSGKRYFSVVESNVAALQTRQLPPELRETILPELA